SQDGISKIITLFRDTKSSIEEISQDTDMGIYCSEHLAKHMMFMKEETSFISSLKAKNIDAAKKSFTSIPISLKPIYLQIPDKDGRAALHWATTIDDDGLIDEILKYLPLDKLQTQDKRDETPLHWAVKSLDENRAAIMTKKLLKSVPIDQRIKLCQIKGEDGKTPLHWAAQRDEVLKSLIQTLLESEKDLFLCLMSQDHLGSTPFHIACSLSEENQAIKSINTILKSLSMSHRAEMLKIPNKEGLTPLHISIRLENAKLAEKISIDILESLSYEDRLISLQDPDDQGITPLHWAISPNILPSILDTLRSDQRSTAINSQDSYGSTPFHWLMTLQKENLLQVLRLIPEESRLSCLKMVDGNNLSPIGDLFEMLITPILETMPPKDLSSLHEDMQHSMNRVFDAKRKRCHEDLRPGEKKSRTIPLISS
ncbi:MAG: hypothetical protein K940chlam1_00755, partial [Candidatus Anoxychlamydiales bacterium]|nr:hypothetical protein [Candidatus Anoxychlamydiales bacterium]